jgi:hypothetical protein
MSSSSEMAYSPINLNCVCPAPSTKQIGKIFQTNMELSSKPVTAV